MTESLHKTRLYHKVFQTRWFAIEATTEAYSNSEPYYRLSCSDSAVILGVTRDKRIILVRQFRPALGVYTLEFPSGYINDGESRVDAAEREFAEETGFVCDSMTYIGSFTVAPSRINTMLHFFLGKDAESVGEEKAEKEIEVVLVTEDKLKQLISDGLLLEVAGSAIYLAARLKGLL